MTRSLVVKVTCGANDPERSNQGLTVAATALSAGAEVSLWLTGDAAWFAVPGTLDLGLAHAAPASDLIALVLGSGRLTVCAQCAARRDLTQDNLFPGTRIAGAATFAEEVLGENVQALVY